ncbi:reverse transcriptase [Eimeria tenella]|uniref:Reverse transcriptase n=1 Tax=Eimeria tenella TaxID=5802 RepID=C8TDM6_EIMTE|nr:reverse transcriptase [Eimeria tenella]
MAKLEHTLFDEWINSTEAQDISCEIAQVLHEYQAVFPANIPQGLLPKRPDADRTLPVARKLPAKSAMYRVTADQLTFQKQEIAKLADSGWIRPTYSPICSSTIMIVKRDDGSGERKMRMVVNYQALNALTIAPGYPLLPIETILEMLGGTKHFSSLDLEAGSHQIPVAKEDRRKTDFLSVLGLFEYRVVPSGLKGASATFGANINAYPQPLLGQGVIAYLDYVLIYSSDLAGHVSLLRQVLRIFLRDQFYPKFSKWKFARQTITYLDKIEAIGHWPEVLENETQVRQFLGTINYCSMFMGPNYADVARPLVDHTRKNVSFKWTELHTQAVRQLKQRLIDFTTLQVPDITKPFELYTNASGYAIGAVL